ncbi:MAG: endonuclease/exonuclease/phosphatase family protein [Rhizobiaceae bacterium]
MATSAPTLPKTLVSTLRKGAPSYIQFDSDHCTSIASYNIHKCVGTDGRFMPDRIAHVVGELNADIVALQEADERLGNRQGLLDLDALHRHTGLVPLHKPDNQLSHGWRGNLILAREGIVKNRAQVRLPGLEPRGAVIVDLELKGVTVRIIAAHFGLLRRSRSLQASTLVEAARSVIHPTILLGDLNEWRVGNRSSLLEFLPHFGPVHAILPSFPSRYPLLALDRILARPANIISSIEIHNSPLARVASDHLPIKAKLNLDTSVSSAG